MNDRFWSKVAESGSCWEWTAAKTNRGYGNFCLVAQGKKSWVAAHRFAYEQLVGEIPSGLLLDHLCRNRACVNPEHLEPVTNRENLRRGSQATRTHCIHGHERTQENTYVKPNGTTACRVCKKLRQQARLVP